MIEGLLLLYMYILLSWEDMARSRDISVDHVALRCSHAMKGH